MNPVTIILVYTIVWWLVFFMALPIGIQAQHEDGEGVSEGTMPSAPRNPMLKKKAIWTSVITAVITFIYYLVVVFELITLDPFVKG